MMNGIKYKFDIIYYILSAMKLTTVGLFLYLVSCCYAILPINSIYKSIYLPKQKHNDTKRNMYVFTFKNHDFNFQRVYTRKQDKILILMA